MLVTVSYKKEFVPLLLPCRSSSELSGSKTLLWCGQTLELSYVAGIRHILHNSIVVLLRLDGRCLVDMLVSSGNGVNDFLLKRTSSKMSSHLLLLKFHGCYVFSMC